MARFLTSGEIQLLRPIFKDTLPYNQQVIGENAREWGGSTNSITPYYEPLFTRSVWTFDLSRPSVSIGDKWIFVHEMTHAWQWYHGRNNIYSAVKLFLRYGSNYDEAYDYNFDDSEKFEDFNFEQQACIVPDYWFVTQGLTPKNAKGMRADLRTYLSYMAQVWASGPPRRAPQIDPKTEYKLRTHL